MPRTTAYTAKIENIQILDETGKLDEKLARGGLKDKDAVFIYEQMTICRHYDEIAFKLQRSGRMGTYPQNKGQEAIAGAGLALKQLAPGSWLVPCYRENIALFINGLPMEKILLHWMGDERGNQIPEGVNITPIAIPIGTHPLHAAGLAWSFKYRGENDKVAVSFFGDGSTSEGDVHEAMNFASALKLPAIFYCQNNGWAISTPRSKQTGSETFAQKGLAYGMYSVQIDGNDIFASYRIMKEAIARATKDNTPTFIEAVTYRLGDHTTADDARRYRDEKEIEPWLAKDPLIRTRKYLESKDLWNESKQKELEAHAKKFVSGIVKLAENIEKPSRNDIFDYTFEQIPDAIRTQRDTMRTSSLGQDPAQAGLSV